MQDNLIDIVNRTYEYPVNECLLLANKYNECICSFRAKNEKKKECDKYMDKFLTCKVSLKELLLQSSKK